jgi:hypothetical protein
VLPFPDSKQSRRRKSRYVVLRIESTQVSILFRGGGGVGGTLCSGGGLLLTHIGIVGVYAGYEQILHGAAPGGYRN